MNIIPLLHPAIRKLALICLVFAPFALTPSSAAELVGKPAAVGGTHAATINSSAAAGQVQAEANQFEQLPDAPPVAPLEPEPPQAPANDAAQGNMQDAMNEMRDNFKHDDFGGFSFDPDMLIPIVAMLLLFGGPVLLVIVLAILHYRAKARRQQNINTNIDKLLAAGRDIPVELLLGEDTTFIKTQVKGEPVVYERNNVLLEKGVKNICVGIGLLIFLTIFLGIKLGSCAFIVIGLGISRLVIWKLSSPRVAVSEAFKVQD